MWRGIAMRSDKLLRSHRATVSLAADALRSLGLHRATDVVGGFSAWAAAGLPTT